MRGSALSQRYSSTPSHYLATGKPVVCTPVEGTADLKELVYLATSEETFENQLLASLAERDESLVQRRQAYAYENSWQARIETVKKILKHVEQPHSI